jgi:hypothetical protein
MLYVKATVIGILVGLLAVVLWLAGTLYWLAAHHPGPFFVSVDARPVLLVAFLGFLVGFMWTVQRTRRSTSST